MTHLCQYAFSKIMKDLEIDIDSKLQIIKECIETDPTFDINYNESYALIVAIGNRHYPLVKFLIENGINVCAQDNKPVIAACTMTTCMTSNMDMIKLLILYGADPMAQNNKPICVANNIDTIKFLIDLGADPFAQNNSPFCEACLYGNLPQIKFLFELGASCIEPDNAPVNAAINRSNLETTRFLLDNGADPNIGDDEIGNLLEKSVYLLNIDICELLMEYGADINLCKLIPDKPNYIRKYSKLHTDKMNKIIELFKSKNVDISHILGWIE